MNWIPHVAGFGFLTLSVIFPLSPTLGTGLPRVFMDSPLKFFFPKLLICVCGNVATWPKLLRTTAEDAGMNFHAEPCYFALEAVSWLSPSYRAPKQQPPLSLAPTASILSLFARMESQTSAQTRSMGACFHIPNSVSLYFSFKHLLNSIPNYFCLYI